MNAPVKRFRDMRLTVEEVEILIHANVELAESKLYWAGEDVSTRELDRFITRAKRLLPLWRDIGLRDLGRLQSALSRKLESENVALTKRLAELIEDHSWVKRWHSAATEHLIELHRNALPTNCTRCNGSGCEDGSPDAGPCERCGGWTEHKRLVAGETDALRKRVAEQAALIECAAAEFREALTHTRDLQSQLAWTPVSAGLSTEPGWYVFHGAEREPELLYGADTGQYSFWVGGSKTYDMEEMSHFSDYRRIELPKDGET